MSYIKTRNGNKLYIKDWGKGRPVVEKKVIVELKTIEKILKLHELQKKPVFWFSGFLTGLTGLTGLTRPFPSGSSVSLEKLDSLLMFLSRCPSLERPEVSALARLRILLPGVQPVLARLELPNHGVLPGAACL